MDCKLKQAVPNGRIRPATVKNLRLPDDPAALRNGLRASRRAVEIAPTV